MWLIDCFAGRGLHPSTDHPDGGVAGTPMQAFFAAVRERRRHPGALVHLRGIEKKTTLALELQRRLVRAPGDAHERPEFRVLPNAFHDALPVVLDEMRADDRHGHSELGGRAHGHRSLWFVDPYGLTPIPHADLDPIAALTGAEMVVNLDVGGLLRMQGAALSALDESNPRSFYRAAATTWNENRLNETWGSDGWRNDIEEADPGDILKSIAQGYANTFPNFKCRNVYPLRGSRSQKRFLVHLTHTPVAEDRFANVWKETFTLGTLAAGDKLDSAERAGRATALFEQLAGETLSVADMYELGLAVSRGQLVGICRAAEEMGLGKFDDRVGVGRMEWFKERLPDPTLFD
jgi:three-Cys-motif partner protein